LKKREIKNNKEVIRENLLNLLLDSGQSMGIRINVKACTFSQALQCFQKPGIQTEFFLFFDYFGIG